MMSRQSLRTCVKTEISKVKQVMLACKPQDCTGLNPSKQFSPSWCPEAGPLHRPTAVQRHKKQSFPPLTCRSAHPPAASSPLPRAHCQRRAESRRDPEPSPIPWHWATGTGNWGQMPAHTSEENTVQIIVNHSLPQSKVAILTLTFPTKIKLKCMLFKSLFLLLLLDFFRMFFGTLYLF